MAREKTIVGVDVGSVAVAAVPLAGGVHHALNRFLGWPAVPSRNRADRWRIGLQPSPQFAQGRVGITPVIAHGALHCIQAFGKPPAAGGIAEIRIVAKPKEEVHSFEQRGPAGMTPAEGLQPAGVRRPTHTLVEGHRKHSFTPEPGTVEKQTA